MKWLLIFSGFLFLSEADAGVLLDFTYNGNSISMGNATKRDDGSLFATGGLFISPGQGQLYVGGGVSSINQAVKNTKTETYSALDYFFGLRWSVFQKNWLWVGVDLIPSSEATFKSTGSPSETWTGTGLIGSLTFFAPSSSDGLMLGLTVDFYSAKYTKKTTSTSSVSSTQDVTGVYPSICLSYLW